MPSTPEPPCSLRLPVLAVALPSLVLGALGGLGTWSLRSQPASGRQDVAATSTRRTLRLTLPDPRGSFNTEPLAPDGRGILFEQDGWLWLQDFAQAAIGRGRRPVVGTMATPRYATDRARATQDHRERTR